MRPPYNHENLGWDKRTWQDRARSGANIMKWTRYNQELPKRWGFKQEIPAHWQHLAVRVQFLFETAWIVRDHENRVYMPDGEWAQTMDFYLKTPGHVIGLRDLQSADGRDWSQEWRTAMSDRIVERLGLTEQQHNAFPKGRW